jgi:hypothetical protein
MLVHTYKFKVCVGKPASLLVFETIYLKPKEISIINAERTLQKRNIVEFDIIPWNSGYCKIYLEKHVNANPLCTTKYNTYHITGIDFNILLMRDSLNTNSGIHCN